MKTYRVGNIEHIGILGNCQVEPMSMALNYLAKGKLNIILKKTLFSNAMFSDEEIKNLRKCESIILIENKIEYFENTPIWEIISKKNVIQVPNLYFKAFHPDLTYARVRKNFIQNGLNSDWNSNVAIVVYKNGGTSKIANEILSDFDFLKALGYLDEWEKSSQFLNSEFRNRGFDFQKWLEEVRIEVPFMFGMNHPKIRAISKLSVQIMSKLNLQEPDNEDEFLKTCTDPLQNLDWPVLPFLESTLGIKSSNLIQFNGKFIDHRVFVELSFKKWERDGLDKNEIELIGGIDFSELYLGTL